ncbi:hypothetical protein BJ322DRAFT_1104787 [Thelephora terrestris]|uniref:DUF6534 domain-containing protein n=1 Tax=Thelephora terrestris TaxID=56493 RepID=A0A9P6LBQ3_9AGAM|nr:hypothetical protein BJ322DRAFT_1104787 [Thelephora terrestris]
MPDSSAEGPLGYILLGVFISLWLCGVISFQALNFFTNYPNERKWVKAFVGALVAADAVQTFMGVGIIWTILIKHSHDADVPQISLRMFQICEFASKYNLNREDPALVGFISGSVQIFFAWRIKVLSTNFALFVLTVVLAIPQFAGGIAYTVLTIKDGQLPDFPHFMGVIIGWVGSSVVCDLVITTTLTMILRRHRANRDLGEAAHLIRRIKIMSIHNGLVTVVWSIALLVALAAEKGGAFYIFFYPLGKVYLITMFSSLNSRPVVRPELDPRINSVLQRHSTPRIPSLSLRSSRDFLEGVEKFERPTSRASNHSRTPSRLVEYLPVTQEEDEDVCRGQKNEGRPSNECGDVQPLIGESSRKETSSPPRCIRSMSNRPRGPRLPAVPCSAAYRSISA